MTIGTIVRLKSDPEQTAVIERNGYFPKVVMVNPPLGGEYWHCIDELEVYNEVAGLART